MSRGKNMREFVPPPHANAAAHKRIMARLRKMSAEEIFQTSVDAGIHRPNGKLTAPYTKTTDVPIR